MSIVAIIVSVISASYYLKIVRVLHSESLSEMKFINDHSNPKGKIGTDLSSLLPALPLGRGKGVEPVMSNFHSLLISILTLSILLFIIKPSVLLNITQLLSLTLFNI